MTSFVKSAIWLYIALLIFEGALRKWIFPGMSNVLLVVRDPVLLAIYALALMSGVVPKSRFMWAVAGMAGISFCFALLAGQTNLWVTLYGIRTNFLHVPLIWVMAEVLDRKDVERIGLFLLIVTIPMTALMILQFKSSPDAWINRGIGQDEGGQIYGAAGHIRPPGFFTFITGPMVFFPLVAAFFLQQVTAGKRRWWWWPILILSGLAIVVALPISISRGTMIATGLVGFVFVLCLLRIGLLDASIVRFAGAAFLLLVALSFLPIFDEARTVFMDRWDTAAEQAEGDAIGSLTNRVLIAFTQPFDTLGHAPVFGHGIGVGSNVGAALLSGRIGFLLAEDEWGKIIMELGPMLGLGYILFRVLLTASLGLVAFRALKRERDMLPMLIFAACASVVLLNQWAQPTQLGFAVVGAGLLLAAVNYVKDESDEDESDDAEGEKDDEDGADAPPEQAAAISEFEARRRRMRGL